MFHHCVVNGVHRRSRKRFRFRANEVLLNDMLFPCLLAGRIYLRGISLQLMEIDGSLEQEHPAVPRIAALFEHSLCRGGIRFFHKSFYGKNARSYGGPLPDITESCFRSGRSDAERDDAPLFRNRAGFVYGVRKCTVIL